MSEQVVLVETVTVRGWVVYWSVPCAVNVAMLGPHGFKGIQLPLNVATWPLSRLVRKATGYIPPVTELVTITLTSVSLPQLVTEPV